MVEESNIPRIHKFLHSILRLFQHTDLEHTPKDLPTGYTGIPFIIG